MSGQFNKSNFEQNPSNLKKKYNTKGWDTNDDDRLCDEEVLDEKDIKAIKEDKWIEKHIPKPCKREVKYKRRINELEAKSLQAPLSKKESKELKKLNKKYKKLYNYRHRDHSSNHITLKCCLTGLVLIFVLACTAVFGGYRYFIQPYTGVTLFELTDILNGFYEEVDEDKIISQKFDPVEDSDKFFESLQQALYLDTKFTLHDLLQLLPQSQGGTGSETASVSDLLDNVNPPATDGTASSITGNPYFDEILSETKFDFSSLETYDGSKQMWEINDKMIAAIMQQIVMNADSIPQIQELVGQYNISIKDCLVVKQCIIKKNAKDAEGKPADVTMQLTIQVRINKLVEGILKGMDLGSLDIISSVVPLLLPKNIYLSAVTTPQIDKSPTLGINAIDGAKLQKLISSLDSKLLNGKVEQIFNTIGNTIFKTFNNITEMVGADNLSIAPSEFDDPNGTGFIKIDILQAAMSKMKIQNVTSSDFLLMVKHLHSIDYKYDNVEEYVGGNVTNPSTIEDFNKSKISLFEAYGISSDSVQDITPENFIDKLSTIPELINIKDAKINGQNIYNISNSTLQDMSMLSDKALAQIMNTMISDKLGNDLKMNVLELTMTSKELNIIAQIDAKSIIEKQLAEQFGGLSSLMSSMFPKNMFIKIIVPKDKKESGPSCDIILNYTKDENSQADSDKMFNTLATMLKDINGEGSALNYDKNTLIKKLDDVIYPILDNFKTDNQDMTIEFIDGGIQLPTIYKLLSNIINEGSSDMDKINEDDIQKTMKSYYTYDTTTTNFDKHGNIIDNVDKTSLDGFIKRELQDKFFIAGEIDDTKVFESITTLPSKLNANEIDTVIDLNSFKKNQKAAQDMNLTVTSLELAKLILQSGEIANIKDIGFYTGFTFVDMKVNSAGTLSLVIAGKLDPDKTTGSNGIKLENFAADYLVVQADVNLNDENYATKVKINSAGDNEINNLLKIVNKIIGANDNNDFNAQTVADDISEAIKEAFNKFKDQGLELTPNEKVIDTPVNGKTDGFSSINIYRLITEKSTGVDNYAEGDDDLLRSVIYKLNNLTGQTDDLDEDDPSHSVTVTERVAEPLRSNAPDGSFTANGKVTIQRPGGSSDIDLMFEDYATNEIKITDYYIGQKIKEATDTDTMKLIKFGLMPKARDTEFRQLITDLGLTNDIVPHDLVANLSGNGVLFFQFKISSGEIGGNDLVNKMIPKSIYGGAFIDLSNLDRTTTYSFINNLTANELAYVNKLVKGKEGDTTTASNITDKLDNMLSNARSFRFNLGSDTTTDYSIADLFEHFRLESAGGNLDLGLICYGMFVREIPELPEITA